MIIYIDNEFRCHASDDGTMREVETDFFDGKSPAFIAGYRYIPPDEVWTREAGTRFRGEMITPAVDYSVLLSAQNEYDQTGAALNALIGGINDA